MTHPTYTHPGANAAMLALSRATRRKVLSARAADAWAMRDETMANICMRQVRRNEQDMRNAQTVLKLINLVHGGAS